MSASQRIEGDRVYCHVCDHEWDRARGGLQCPQCESEFVEIIDSNSRPGQESPPPIPPHPRFSQPPPIPPHPRSSQSPQSPRSPDSFHNHNPWSIPDPGEDDIRTFSFNTRGGGRGTFSFTSRTYTIGGGNIRRDPASDEISRNFEQMLGSLIGHNQRRQPPMMGGGIFQYPPNRNDRGFGGSPDLFSVLFQAPGQPRNPNHPPTPFDLLGALFNTTHAQHGDMVFSQEAFDRVMTQLMEQNQNNAPGPASDAAIAALKKKPVDAEMLGSDGKAECSICMDNVELGDEVTVLPCNHWFHGECVISWLKEHNTCPHCRSPITNPQDANISSSSHSQRRRRTSRRSSSVASPMNATEGNIREAPLPDSPSGMREARQRYYGNRRTSDYDDRPPRERRSSERSQRSSDNNGGGGGSGGGGLASWVRSHLPFSG